MGFNVLRVDYCYIYNYNYIQKEICSTLLGRSVVENISFFGMIKLPEEQNFPELLYN